MMAMVMTMLPCLLQVVWRSWCARGVESYHLGDTRIQHSPVECSWVVYRGISQRWGCSKHSRYTDHWILTGRGKRTSTIVTRPKVSLHARCVCLCLVHNTMCLPGSQYYLRCMCVCLGHNTIYDACVFAWVTIQCVYSVSLPGSQYYLRCMCVGLGHNTMYTVCLCLGHNMWQALRKEPPRSIYN